MAEKLSNRFLNIVDATDIKNSKKRDPENKRKKEIHIQTEKTISQVLKKILPINQPIKLIDYPEKGKEITVNIIKRRPEKKLFTICESDLLNGKQIIISQSQLLIKSGMIYRQDQNSPYVENEETVQKYLDLNTPKPDQSALQNPVGENMS